MLCIYIYKFILLHVYVVLKLVSHMPAYRPGVKYYSKKSFRSSFRAGKSLPQYGQERFRSSYDEDYSATLMCAGLDDLEVAMPAMEVPTAEVNC